MTTYLTYSQLFTFAALIEVVAVLLGAIALVWRGKATGNWDLI